MQSRADFRWTDTERVYLWLGMAGAAAFLVLFVVVALRRMPYVYELEWMEGGMVDEVGRILQGKPLYVEPTVDYVPFGYPPAFFYVSAWLSQLVGLGFVPLRLVSFLASLGCFGMLFLIVLRETGDSALGLMAAGLEAATFHVSGSWFDIGRIDSLFLVLFLGAVYCLRFLTTAGGCAVAGALFAAAFFTKQTALFAASPILVWAVVTKWRRGLLCAAVFGGLVIGISLAWNQLSHGWFDYYIFEMPRHHTVVKGMWWKFWTLEVGRSFPIPILLALPLFAFGIGDLSRSFYAAVAAGLIGAAWLVRIQSSTYVNVLIPAYAALALVAPLGALALASQVRLRRVFSCAALAAIAGQFALLWYPPAKEIPTAADREAGDALVKRLGAIGGDIWIPGHAYLATRVGSPPHAQTVAIGDVLTAGGYIKQQLSNEIRQALHNQRFSAVAVDSTDELFNSELRARYERAAGGLFTDRDAFYPVTGNRTRPRMLYVPQTGESRPAALLYSR